MLHKALLFKLFFIIFLIDPLSAQESTESAMLFKWAFLTRHGSEAPQVIDCKVDTIKLADEDQLKIFFRPMQQAYIYLFLQDAQDELYLLFPAMISDFDEFYTFNKNYYIPKGEEWFFLDNTQGTEKFHIIVSSERLIKLEELTVKYLACYSDNSAEAIRVKEARQMVVEELKTVRLTRGQEQSRENLVLVACDFRGISDQYEFKAIEVETEGFYAKTIRIEH